MITIKQPSYMRFFGDICVHEMFVYDNQLYIKTSAQQFAANCYNVDTKKDSIKLNSAVCFIPQNIIVEL